MQEHPLARANDPAVQHMLTLVKNYVDCAQALVDVRRTNLETQQKMVEARTKGDSKIQVAINEYIAANSRKDPDAIAKAQANLEAIGTQADHALAVIRAAGEHENAEANLRYYEAHVPRQRLKSKKQEGV